jgi:hypothetical protein
VSFWRSCLMSRLDVLFVMSCLMSCCDVLCPV